MAQREAISRNVVVFGYVGIQNMGIAKNMLDSMPKRDGFNNHKLHYLIICVKNNSTNPRSSDNNNKKKAPAAYKSPVFDCDCFDCYTNYWFRWDMSVNRELIHQVIEAFEENLTSSEQVNCRGRKPNQKKEKASHWRFAGKALNPPLEVSVSPSYDVSLVEECAKEEHEVVEESPETDATARRGLQEVKGLFNWRLWGLWSP
ncbi:uncharacterized protein LOC118481778 [Helianthus annuus]|uniref:uncharacterized protein LOC118481778 n=1 Tax=Helianthus annuus TaxID=4232 RepID=UPI0016530596|nr:uncharacterized protein LOC118481778 [Helianthus annuus]